jgi:hypothetical protein
MNRLRMRHIISVAAVWLAAAVPARAATLRCPPDSVKVGNGCIAKPRSSDFAVTPSPRASRPSEGPHATDVARLGVAGAPRPFGPLPAETPAQERQVHFDDRLVPSGRRRVRRVAPAQRQLTPAGRAGHIPLRAHIGREA